jgi:AbrB family looped-hinge helix DNA binding protein
MQKEIKEIKTVTITDKGQICIPNIARLNGFKEGSKVNIIVYNDRVEVRPMKQISDAMLSMLASEKALAKIWNTREEDKAWKDL